MVEAGKAYIVPLDFGYRGKRTIILLLFSIIGRSQINILKENPYVVFVFLDHSFRLIR